MSTPMQLLRPIGTWKSLSRISLGDKRFLLGHLDFFPCGSRPQDQVCLYGRYGKVGNGPGPS